MRRKELSSAGSGRPGKFVGKLFRAYVWDIIYGNHNIIAYKKHLYWGGTRLFCSTFMYANK